MPSGFVTVTSMYPAACLGLVMRIRGKGCTQRRAMISFERTVRMQALCFRLSPAAQFDDVKREKRAHYEPEDKNGIY
jgi:hypothetical protein